MRYHKIKNVFIRDPETKYRYLLEDEYTTSEFALLENIKWRWTEKVDGTNIRVYWNPDVENQVVFAGREEKSQIPPLLIERLRELFPPALFENFPQALTLYGEGYGGNIQGGGNYGAMNFILFDAVIAKGVFLEHRNVLNIADQLGVQVVPTIGFGPLPDAVQMVKNGFFSRWRWQGSFQAEGIVATPVVELLDRTGNRIITKIKYKDFYRVAK